MIGNVTEMTNPGSLLKLQHTSIYSGSTSIKYRLYVDKSTDNGVLVDKITGNLGYSNISKVGCVPKRTLYVPLQFWF